MTVSVEEVGRIAGLRDPVIRNLQITECYARLAAGVVSGGANWCTFATWASKQAGCTIRGEDLDAAVRRELGRDASVLHPIQSFWRWLLRRGLFDRESRLGSLVWRLHTPFDAFELASDAVARGNRKVFEEIGLQFARYLTLDFASFMEGLQDPDLRAAFTHLEAGRATNDRELIVLANLEIGLHEQERLQPEIRAALDAATAPSQPLVVRVFGWPLQRQLTRLSREVITGSFMVLTLPGAALSLAHHLDVPLSAATNPELLALITRFEPVPPAADNCGAHDWSELQQRMHYISHLFRAYDTHPELADPPFTPEQMKLIQAGRLPDGAL